MATIGVNLLWLVPGVVGGSEEYTVRLLRALSELGSGPAQGDGAGPAAGELGAERGLRVRLYGQPSLVDAHPDLAERYETVLAPTAVSRSKLARIAAEHTWLASATARDDLVHHAGGVVPAVRSQPSIVTIHDLQPLELPAYFSAPKRRWLATMIPYSARVARLVVCPSEFTAGRVRELLATPPGKVRVVAHGIAGCGTRPAGDAPQASSGEREARSRFGRFLLLPAIAYRHKRHADLIAALDLLRHRFADLAVVITGRAGPETAALHELAGRRGLTARVHQLGRVPEAELDGLYRDAPAR
jgi:alpha-1,3-rhamnosyl/mannosyltransferase